MRKINTIEISRAVSELAQKTNYGLTDDVCSRIERCKRDETDARAKDILTQIEKNIDIAGEERIPLCQDTGLACVFWR